MHNKKQLLAILLLISSTQINAIQYLDPEEHQVTLELAQVKKEDAQRSTPSKSRKEDTQTPLMAGIITGGAMAYAGNALLFANEKTIGQGLWYYMSRNPDESYAQWYTEIYHKEFGDVSMQSRIKGFNMLVGIAGLYACYKVAHVAYTCVDAYCKSGDAPQQKK